MIPPLLIAADNLLKIASGGLMLAWAASAAWAIYGPGPRGRYSAAERARIEMRGRGRL